MNLRIPTTAIAIALSSLCSANAAEFLPINAFGHNMVSDNPGGDPELAGGAGVGFDAAEPHSKISGDDNWYTDAPGGFPSDYIDVHTGPEYIWFDLGSDVLLNEISYWGYANTNANGMREFNLGFATDAEGGEALLGDESYGTTITVNPSFVALQEDTLRQSFEFPEVVTARYVRVEATSTFFNQPGAGAGGDRLGIGDIAFEQIGAIGEPNISVPASLAPAVAHDTTTDFDVTVTNTGDQLLTISGTNFSGTNAAAFSAVVTPASIPAASAADITVRFDPTGLEGSVSATLEIMSDDPDTGTAEVIITAVLPASGPDISVPTEVALTGEAAQTLDVPVDNLGRTQLDISGTNITGPNAAAFSVSSSPVNIAALSSGAVQVAFNPTGLPAGPVSATLEISSNDPNTATASVLLTGGISSTFYPISEVDHNMEDGNPGGNPRENIIQGSGIGFDAASPHDKLGGAGNWYTDQAGDNYPDLHEGPEYVWLDLGSDVALDEISVWGYANGNANGIREFNLSFATDAEGGAGGLGDESYGSLIPLNPAFTALQDETIRQSFTFETVFARYVRVESTSNYSGLGTPGGDRLGIGEIAFRVSDATDVDFAVTEIDIVGTDVVFTFRSKPSRLYSIWRTTDLRDLPGDWEELSDSYPSDGDFTTFTDADLPAGTLRMFYQARPGL